MAPKSHEPSPPPPAANDTALGLREAEIVPLSRFRDDVARSLARRGKVLLSSDNLAEEIPAMAPVELYYVIKELGVDEAAPILMAASTEQFTALCDLDCWDRDTFVAEELDAWLAPLMAEGPEIMLDTFLRLDDEVQVLFVQASLRVLDNRAADGSVRKTEELPWPEDIPQDAPWKATSDGFFTLIDISQDREVPPLVLVDALMAYDANEGFRLLTASRWELESTLMEEGLRFRDGRMLDLGFCSNEDAMRLFALPPRIAEWRSDANEVSCAPKNPAPRSLPVLYAEAMAEAPCALIDALAHVRSLDALADLKQQLVVLINAAVVGYGHSPKHVGQVGEVARWVRDTLSLGLSLWQPSQPAADALVKARAAGTLAEAHANVLVQTPLLHLFQRGMAAVRPLQRRAQHALTQPHVRAWLEAAPVDNDHDHEGQARAFLRALAGARPLWGGQVAMRPEKLRAWQTDADVAATGVQLEALLRKLGAL